MNSVALTIPASEQKGFSIYGESPYPASSLFSNFLPLPTNDYIAICCDNDYKYWPEVFELIASLLAKSGISILDVSRANNSPISHCVKIPDCTIRQSAYILENSLLSVCGDDWVSAIGARNGVNTFKVQTKDKSFQIGATENADKDSMPEVVAKGIVEALGIDSPIVAKTQAIGEQYGIEVVEIIPDFSIQPGFSVDPNKRYGVRCDLCENWIFVKDFCLRGYKPTVTCSKLPPEPLLPFLKGIENLVVLMSLDISVEGLQKVKEAGISCILICENPDELEALKAKFFDFDPIQENEEIDENFLDKIAKLPYDTGLKSNRAILSKFGTFLSSYHYRNQWDVSKRKGVILGDALEDPEFLKEAELFYYYTTDE